MKTNYLPILLCLTTLGCLPVQDDRDEPVRVLDSCGDGVCDGVEDPRGCPEDCAAAGASVCGDGTCDADESEGSCAQDCAFWCGDGFCDLNDLGTSCEEVDCGADLCGNGFCDFFEFTEVCPQDCPAEASYCGDGTCDADETPSTCQGDCPLQTRCGDGTCDANEDSSTCPSDCPVAPRCGDGTCDAGETPDTCLSDCPRACEAACDGRSCGPDGCGGVCDVCSGGETCDAAGVCQPPAPSPESFSYTIQHSFTGPRAGATEPVTMGSGGSIYCDMDEAAGLLLVSMSQGGHQVEVIIEDDPIAWCLFNTSTFNKFSYVSSDASGFSAWGIDSLGNTSGLSLACTRNSARTQLTGTFSSGHLFRGRNSSVEGSNYVDIQDGAFTCDL